jgi:hypothetical protein
MCSSPSPCSFRCSVFGIFFKDRDRCAASRHSYITQHETGDPLVRGPKIRVKRPRSVPTGLAGCAPFDRIGTKPARLDLQTAIGMRLFAHPSLHTLEAGDNAVGRVGSYRHGSKAGGCRRPPAQHKARSTGARGEQQDTEGEEHHTRPSLCRCCSR